MIDINKKYRYRNKGMARILCVDAPHEELPVICLDEDGIINRHTSMGVSSWGIDYDLIEVKEKKVLWLNVFEGDCTSVFRDIVSSDLNSKHRIARIRVEYEEGQYDE